MFEVDVRCMGLMYGVDYVQVTLAWGIDVWVDTGKHTVNSALLVSLKAVAEDNSWRKQYDCVL